jgi:hypothetical protein
MAAQARRCRRLAKYADGQVRDTLELLAEDYEKRQKTAEVENPGEAPIMRLGPANDVPP